MTHESTRMHLGPKLCFYFVLGSLTRRGRSKGPMTIMVEVTEIGASDPRKWQELVQLDPTVKRRLKKRGSGFPHLAKLVPSFVAAKLPLLGIAFRI
ncbi:hypothetical protein VNO77_18954 [Canavalia gladiata]|uniref:Uncharacterized protein n=1 Tax=Canavalia gladiata TaxID=3824 RepID=A0AAN9LQN3_CANGL